MYLVTIDSGGRFQIQKAFTSKTLSWSSRETNTVTIMENPPMHQYQII